MKYFLVRVIAVILAASPAFAATDEAVNLEKATEALEKAKQLTPMPEDTRKTPKKRDIQRKMFLRVMIHIVLAKHALN